MRDLNQYPCAIAGFRIATASAAMSEVDKNLQSFQYDIVRLLTLYVNYEANAASVVFVTGVIKSLLDWESIIHLFSALPIRCFGMSHQYTKFSSIEQLILC